MRCSFLKGKIKRKRTHGQKGDPVDEEAKCAEDVLEESLKSVNKRAKGEAAASRRKGSSKESPSLEALQGRLLEGPSRAHVPKSTHAPGEGFPFGRPTVLLLDEVDVFFGDGFYGRPYRPCTDVDHDDGFNLICRVWENREKLPNTKSSIQSLLDSKEARAIKKSFPNMSNDFIERFRSVLCELVLWALAVCCANFDLEK